MRCSMMYTWYMWTTAQTDRHRTMVVFNKRTCTSCHKHLCNGDLYGGGGLVEGSTSISSGRACIDVGSFSDQLHFSTTLRAWTTS